MKVQRLLFPGSSVRLEELPIFDSVIYLKPFDDKIIHFLDQFSRSILLDKSLNRLPEMAALGFWLRKANLMLLKKENKHLFDNPKYQLSPIGKVLHICPSNVDTMFLYSMAVSLLMGNQNILRISSRMKAPTVVALFGLLRDVLKQNENSSFQSFVELVSYEHNSDINEWISSRVNARLIWGGDATIDKFRQYKSAPRTKDIVFADRISLMILNCKSILELKEVDRLAFSKSFFNDTYTFDQMGCASPQTIFFIGTAAEYQACVTIIIEMISSQVEKNSNLDINSLATLKLNRAVDDALNEYFTEPPIGNNLIRFIPLSKSVDVSNLHGCGGGYFYIQNLDSLENIPEIRKPKVQTITYFGLTENEKQQLIELANGEGIDRIVPLGQALTFDYIWDGYQLFDELSKKIAVK
ncbi:MAG: acyl-CoA reductase [Saprospiraceae bacterium]|nr:acyl-CoA reductase [Saprospiraceae bacterium]